MKLKPLSIAAICLIVFLETSFANEFIYTPVVININTPHSTNIASVIMPAYGRTGHEFEVSVVVIDNTSQIVSTGTVIVNYSSVLSSGLSNATYSNGVFRTNLLLPSSGTWNISFMYTGNENYLNSTTFTSFDVITGYSVAYDATELPMIVVDFIGGVLSALATAAESIVWLIIALASVGIGITIINKLEEMNR